MSIDELRRAARALSHDERRALALELLEEDSGPDLTQAEWTEAWSPVIQRRLDAVEDGTAELLSVEDTFARAREAVAQSLRRRA